MSAESPGVSVLKRVSPGRRSTSPGAGAPRKDGEREKESSDPVIVCCKKLPDARTLDEIKAAICVLKAV